MWVACLILEINLFFPHSAEQAYHKVGQYHPTCEDKEYRTDGNKSDYRVKETVVVEPRHTHIVEDAAGMLITELQRQSLTDAICGDLEKHAYSVNDRISDSKLRTMHIMAGV